MRKMLLILALFLSGKLEAATNTPTPDLVTGGINDSSIEYIDNVGIGIRREVITDKRGTPINTSTPGAIVVTNTFTVTPTPTLTVNTQTPTQTLTPAGVVPYTVTGTVTPNTVNCFNCTPPPTQIPLATPGGSVVCSNCTPPPTPFAVFTQIPLATPGGNVQEIGPATTAVPTVVLETTPIPFSRDLTGKMRAIIYGAGSSSSAVNVGNPGDAAVASVGISTVDQQAVYNGTNWDRQRASTTVNSLTITATGNTAIIGANTNGANSPLLSGNKWRFLWYEIYFTGDASDASANCLVTFQDNTTRMGPTEMFDIPTVALNTFFRSPAPIVNLGNGIASASANNALNVNLSSALTGGECVVKVGFVQGTTP